MPIPAAAGAIRSKTSDDPMTLTFYNTATKRKETFTPIDPANVRMYACGPTVYDYAHIGNGRMAIVFDMVFRVLRQHYGAANVTYARNITDVDDKINERAARDYPNETPETAIARLTAETALQYQTDVAALGCLAPTIEPRATEHMAEMRTLIDTLIARGHAYVAENHVLFAVPSMPAYGRLSNRSVEEMEAGARVDVAPYKKSPMDFVLWKPSEPGLPAWPSPGGIPVPGRPGWHIECSAMAFKHLGAVFDIHGGGVDLVFPHHENELAQSTCAHGTDVMARVWMHNGFLQVNGEKMSKSLGNFFTIDQLLRHPDFGGRAWHGRVLRFAMLGTHYRQPIDWTVERVLQARTTLVELAEMLAGVPAADAPHADIIAALEDDLNTPSAISIIHGLSKSAKRGNVETASALKASLAFMGVLEAETRADLMTGEPVVAIDENAVRHLVEQRLAARRRKDFKESDRLRDELAAMGVSVKDAKDPRTGEIVTTWEVAG
jgi:cysteinyl-tRNA synthetase